MDRLEIIPWREFQIGIAPLWKNQNPQTIPIYNNPFGLIQYSNNYLHQKIIYFPCRYVINNHVVGYISIYNISDIHIRPRGIYILEEYQGIGLGHKMQQLAWDLFPKSFYRAFIITAQAERFCIYSKMKIVPNIPTLFSKFSNQNLKLLCHERQQYPTNSEIEENQNWIEKMSSDFSFGGKNNLNCNWNSQEWLEYFDKNKGDYENYVFNLDVDLC